MKKVRILVATALTFVFCTLVIISCQKAASNTGSTATDVVEAATLGASATSDEQANNIFNGVVDNVVGVNSDAGLGNGIGVFSAANPKGGGKTGSSGAIVNGMDSTVIPTCYSVTIKPATPGVYPKTITVDFGGGCTGRDGRTRKGKIITVYSGRLKKAGSTATTTFDGYYVDTVHVEGTHTITNNSTGGNLIFTLALQNGKLSTPSGNYVAVNRTHTWTQAAGDTSKPAEVVFNITGNSNGTIQASGVTWQWSTDITQALVRNFSCRWIVSGTENITHGTKTGVLDFGAGTCDNEATLTVGTKVYNITLR